MVSVPKVLLVTVLALMGADSCGKYDVPAGGDHGDSAGNNQPAQQCQPGKIQIAPVKYRAPAVYNYVIFVEVEDEDCDAMNFKDKMAVDRVGSYGNPERFVVFDDGKSGVVHVPSPYRTGFVIEKAKPHHLSVEASVVVTPAMLKVGAAWLTCRIERDGVLVTGLGQVGLARTSLGNVGIHTVICIVLT